MLMLPGHGLCSSGIYHVDSGVSGAFGTGGIISARDFEWELMMLETGIAEKERPRTRPEIQFEASILSTTGPLLQG